MLVGKERFPMYPPDETELQIPNQQSKPPIKSDLKVDIWLLRPEQTKISTT